MNQFESRPGCSIVPTSKSNNKSICRGFSDDIKTSKFEFYGIIPELVVRGDYNAKAKLFFSTIEGNGTYVVTLKQIAGAIKFKPKADRVEDGKTYMKVDKLKVLLEPKT